MRAVFLILGLLMYFPLIAQDYIPMLNNQNEWHLIYCDENDCYKDIYYTVADTVSYGKTYKVLDGYHYISKTFWLREDIQQKKIFGKTILNPGNEETLLYDFGLNEGDSIKMYNPITPFPEDAGYFTLDSIKVRPILEDQNSRFFYFSPSISNEDTYGLFPIWVEGVGSLSITTAPGGQPDYDEIGQVACFWKNGHLFYHDDERISDCESVLDLVSNEPSKVNFVVTTQKVGLLTHAENLNKIEIFDANGRRLFRQNFKSNSTIQIDLKTYQKGIYYLRAIEDKKVWSRTFIIR